MAAIAGIPVAVLTDSYKATHPAQYPDAKRMVAYGEFRRGFEGCKDDTRLVFYGIRYIIENFLNRKWTEEDVHRADLFFSTHNAGGSPMFFPKELFLKFIHENNGYFPIKIQALPEGTCIHAHVPVYQITADAPYSRLVTFFETLLTHVWYPTSVATLSRRTKEVIRTYFNQTVDDDQQWLLHSRLHDFGFRGCTSVEQSVLGGLAHLLNFTGSDTMSACFYGQFHLNGGRPVGESIPASEHSVMTSWPTERDAMRNMIEKFGTGIYAVVMDSYDYERAIFDILPTLAEFKVEKGGFIVLRPDSGDPVEAVMLGLQAAEKAFGSTTNSKGFRVINKAGVIQGDGINYNTVCKILVEATSQGYSAQNIAFGMGGGLLQKVNRDTMSFATKLSFIHDLEDVKRDVMKYPKTDSGKFSLPGIMKVVRVDGVPTAFPQDVEVDGEDMLRVVYDSGPVEGAFPEEFSALKDRVEKEWQALPAVADVISAPLKVRIDNWIEANRERFVGRAKNE